MLGPLLVDHTCRNLLRQRFRLAAFKQTVFDVGLLTFALGAPDALRHDTPRHTTPSLVYS